MEKSGSFFKEEKGEKIHLTKKRRYGTVWTSRHFGKGCLLSLLESWKLSGIDVLNEMVHFCYVYYYANANNDFELNPFSA
jgi:hypothetical protein